MSSSLKRTAFSRLGERRYERLRALYLAGKIRSGQMTNPEVALLPAVVREAETVVDVGANYGLYAFHLARLVGPRGRVIAFEASPVTATALRRIVTLVRVGARVEVREQAAGEENGSLRLVVPRRGDGSTESGLAWGLPHGAAGDVPAGEVVEVPLVRLDDVIGEGTEVTFLKVDVEGADLRVLRGARGLLTRSVPTLLLEVSPPLLARQGMTPADVAGFLRELGYETFAFDARSRRLSPRDAALADGDLVAVHPRRRDRVAPLLG